MDWGTIKTKTFFLFVYENKLRKNIETEISEILRLIMLRMCPRLKYLLEYILAP